MFAGCDYNLKEAGSMNPSNACLPLHLPDTVPVCYVAVHPTAQALASTKEAHPERPQLTPPSAGNASVSRPAAAKPLPQHNSTQGPQPAAPHSPGGSPKPAAPHSPGGSRQGSDPGTATDSDDVASEESFQQGYSAALAQQLRASSMADSFKPLEQADLADQVRMSAPAPSIGCGSSSAVEGCGLCMSLVLWAGVKGMAARE